MKPLILLDTAKTTFDGKEFRLYQHDADFLIKVGNSTLMNSRMHGSEEALAEFACQKINHLPKPRVLIGGLGMGFTLRAALDQLPKDAEVVVAELMPEVVKWNQGVLAKLTRNAVADKRVTVFIGDVEKKIKEGRSEYSAILLDVDNGPLRLFRQKNDRLYNMRGLHSAYKALTPNGVMAVWASEPDPDFTRRLRAVQFTAELVKVRARFGPKAGGHHVIWVARKARA